MKPKPGKRIDKLLGKLGLHPDAVDSYVISAEFDPDGPARPNSLRSLREILLHQRSQCPQSRQPDQEPRRKHLFLPLLFLPHLQILAPHIREKRRT